MTKTNMRTIQKKQILALNILESLEEKTTIDYEGLTKQEVLEIIIKEI